MQDRGSPKEKAFLKTCIYLLQIFNQDQDNIFEGYIINHQVMPAIQI